MASLHDITVVAFIRHLTIVKALLHKGREHCKANNMDEATLSRAKLAPDMGDLQFQIKVITNMARSGVFVPSWKFVPTVGDPTPQMDFDAMDQRLQSALDYLKSVPRPTEEQEKAALQSEYVFYPGGPQGPAFRFDSAVNILMQFILPNFFFHMTTTYDILRHNGVELGKANFLAEGVGKFN